MAQLALYKRGIVLKIRGKQKPYVMAHRGNMAACPENTLAAFRRAIAEGADIIETDIRRTVDRVFVCIHDETVDRTTDGNGVVEDMTLAEIKALSASNGREEFQAERVPALSEAAALIPDGVALALELKTDSFLQREVCSELISELERAAIRDRVFVISFSMPRLKAIREVDPDIPVGWITLSSPWPMAGVQFLGPYWPLLLANPFYVMFAHRRGQVVCPLDHSSDSRLWLYRLLGCDAVLTDDPGRTCRVLGRR